MPVARRGSRARRIAGASLTCFLTACVSGEDAARDTTALPAQGAAPTATPGEDWLNALDGNVLFAALNDSTRWIKSADSPRQRRCATAPCGPRGPATVNLWVERNANTVGDGDAADTAILVGKLRHVGGEESRMYRLRPGPYIYALFILQGTATGGRYQVRELNIATKQHAARADGDWIRCNHNLQATSSAYFRPCEAPHPPEDGTAAVTHEDPAWFTCTAGCCTAGATEL